MVQLVDGMLIINLDALCIAVRANILPVGAIALLAVLYLLGGRKR